MSSERWKQITPSQFPWEREALDYVREHLPDCDPYRVWANFEFIADDGTINEVDILVLTPRGFFLVEIKSRPGTLSGDRATWVWRSESAIIAHPLDITVELVLILRHHCWLAPPAKKT
jgi:hypothetical protein